MIPFGGISVVVHLLVNLLAWIGERVPSIQRPFVYLPLPAPVLFVFFVGFILLIVATLLGSALADAHVFTFFTPR